MSAAVNASTLTVTWDPSPNAEVAGYVISFGTQSNNSSNTVDVGNVTSYAVNGLTDGVSYWFVVQAYNTVGTLGDPSTAVSAIAGGATAPVITCPAPAATSSNGASVAVSFAAVVTGGVMPVGTTCTPASGSFFSVGSTPVTCTALDAVGQAASCSTNVVVTSTAQAPPPLTLTCPAPLTVTSPTGGPIVTSYYPPVVSGGSSPTVTCTPTSGSSVFPIGTTQITCNAVDLLQQTATCTTTLTVTAAPPPPPPPPALTMTCPAPAPAYSTTGSAISVTYPAPTMVGGLAPVNAVCAPQSGSFFSPGTTQVQCSAQDAASQVATCGMAVVVNVAPPPAIACPVIAPILTKAASGSKVVYSMPAVTGGAAPVNTACTPASGSKFTLGNTTIMCKAVDALQRTASCTTVATVIRSN